MYGLSTGLAGVDTDGDGLSDEWETQFGTDPNADDAAADPDGDGLTNLQEQANGTHPTGYFTRYLAEGSTGAFFDDRIALFNPGADLATVVLRFQRDSGAEEQGEGPGRWRPYRGRGRHPVELLEEGGGQLVGVVGAKLVETIEMDAQVLDDRVLSGGWSVHGLTSELS